MVAGGKFKQPYHVRVLGVEESEAGIGLSVSYCTCRNEHRHGFHDYAGFAYHAGDHGVAEPWLASMQKKSDRPDKEYWH